MTLSDNFVDFQAIRDRYDFSNLLRSKDLPFEYGFRIQRKLSCHF